jgi:predicted amidohydrolase
MRNSLLVLIILSAAPALAQDQSTFGQLAAFGTLKEGAEADVAVFSLKAGDFLFTDSLGATRTGHQKLIPVATVKAGRIYGSASIPVVSL